MSIATLIIASFTSFASFTFRRPWASILTSCGRTVLNVETRVVDAQMNDVPVGETGEIVHRTPHLITEYWNRPEATAEAFEGGWFHSGDMGKFDEEGFLYVVDRLKDVINTGGVLVASREDRLEFCDDPRLLAHLTRDPIGDLLSQLDEAAR